MSGGQRGGEMFLERRLTNRELEVLRLGAYANKQIALQLDISAQTIKNHWTSIYKAFQIKQDGGYSQRTRAMMLAWVYGVLSLDEIEEGDERCE